MSTKRLYNELKQYKNDPNYFYSVGILKDNILLWEFIIIGPSDSLYEGGTFKGEIKFPNNYPNSPPIVKFTSDIIHPNIYKNGEVCISILHEGIDEYNYESTSERWNPSHGVNTIMMSIVSMLCDPNIESPANVEASILFKDNYNLYKNRVYDIVSKT
jgi:ubiquitin-protein ligase